MMTFDEMKVFSATKARDRDLLGEKVTEWLKRNPRKEIVGKEVLQSSDNEFHCLTIILWCKNGR